MLTQRWVEFLKFEFTFNLFLILSAEIGVVRLRGAEFYEAILRHNFVRP